VVRIHSLRPFLAMGPAMADQTSLTFDRDFAPAYGTAEILSPLIRRVVCGNPGPFTFTGTASFILGEKTLAIIDPGPENEAHLSALLKAIGDKPLSHIFITHTHLDHSPLARRLKSLTGAKTVGFSSPPAAGSGENGAMRLDASRDTDFRPDIALKDGERIESSEWALTGIHTPGHTSDHMAFALDKERALFTGDHVMAWSTSVVAPPDGNMGSYLRSLEALLRRHDDIYFPTHGPPRKEPRALVRAFLAHRRMREGAILARLKGEPKSLRELVAAIYADVDPRLHTAAGQTTLAHLQHLIAQGKVVGETGNGGDLYRLS
jgi:glyoxylase-like metal-dependent hydrolase (beta-lactamase superfamily II)